MKIRARYLFLIAAIGLAVGVYIFALSLSGGIQLRAAGVAWDGGGDGVTWEDPNNWDNDSIPTAVDDVEIDANVTVQLNGATTINSLDLGNAGGTTTPTLNFAYDAIGDELVIDDGALRIYQNATITHSAGTNVIVGTVGIDIQTGSATIEGSINANNKGYAASEGPGAGTDNASGAGGGSYGGYGGTGGTTGTGAPGDVYGNVTSSLSPGSGGGNSSSQGGAGGGAIRMAVAGILNVNSPGIITANGQSATASNSGGGSGGLVSLNVGTLTGSGTILANGGAGHSNAGNHPGSGGGGRIIVNYDSLTMSDANIHAFGGMHASVPYSLGGAGTVYLKDDAESFGDLIIDNNDNLGPARDDRFIGRTALTPEGVPLSISFNAILIRNRGNLDLNSDTTIAYTSLTWSDSGIITDNGGGLPLIDANASVSIPETSALFLNVSKTWSALTVAGTLTHSNNRTTGAGELYKVDATSTGDITITAAGLVDVSDRGFIENNGPGAGSVNPGGAGGGSHGGVGGTGDNDFDGAPGDVYGSITAPVKLGSGGGTTTGATSVSDGARGGGAVKLQAADTLTVNGPIRANGGETSQISWGGASGGSVFLLGATVTGSSTVEAHGGNGDDGFSAHPGSGGGGRISIVYDTFGLTESNVHAYGGMNSASEWSLGGAGTVYLKDTAVANGSLIINNNDTEGDISDDRYIGRTRLTSDGDPLSLALDELIIRNKGNLDLTDDTTLTYSTISWSDSGIITDNGGVLALVSGGGALTVPDTATLYANTPRTWSSVVVNGRLTHSNNGLTSQGQMHEIDITSTGNVTVNASGSIDANERGYIETHGPGAGSSNTLGGGGASHGGVGGIGRDDGLGTPGDVYGSITTPVLIGSGGGTQTGALSINSGSRGGGAISITAESGTVLVSGPISANATPTHSGISGGGGSGGSVLIDASVVSGTSTIDANGGSGYTNSNTHPGSGGGGRVAVHYDTLSLSATNVHAYGGVHASFNTSLGGAGTVFLKANADTYGDLIVGNNNKTFLNNDDRFIGRTKLTPTGSPLAFTVDELIIRDSGNLVLSADTSLIYSTLSWNDDGIVTDNGGVSSGLTSGALTIPLGAKFLANTARTYSSLSVSGVLSHSRNQTTETYKINITTTGNVTVAASGEINIAGVGYTSPNGPGAGEDDGVWGAGAGHGGVGGVTDDVGSTGGPTYGSSTAPVTIGSGGGNDGTGLGGPGGGAVKLTVGGDMVFDGTADATAGDPAGTDGGGGSGGSVYFTIAGAMTGSGPIAAEGGDAQDINAGAGGGGRVRVDCSDGSAWTPNVSVVTGSVGNPGGEGSFSDECSAVGGGGGGGGSGSDITAEVENETLSVLTGTEKLCDNTSGIADSHAAIAGCSNVSVVNLVAGSTLAVTLFVQVRDDNGESDIASSGHTGVYYHGVNATPVDETCAADNNDCYHLIGTKSAVINSTDAWVRYNFNLEYYTDSSIPSGNWVGFVEVLDNSSSTDDNVGDEYTNEVNSIVSITFPDVVFGAINLPFTSSDTDNIEVAHQNNGNVLVDANINLDGGQMTCGAGSIPSSSIKFDPASDAAYGSMSKTLTSSPTNVEMDIEVEQRVNDGAPQTGVDIKESYWGLSVMSGISGACTGTLNVTAFEGP